LGGEFSLHIDYVRCRDEFEPKAYPFLGAFLILIRGGFVLEPNQHQQPDDNNPLAFDGILFSFCDLDFDSCPIYR
jgi:hypothetical protein